MNIILLLIPLSFVLLGVGVWAFFWAVEHAQFDDLDSPALMPLAEDDASTQAGPSQAGPTQIDPES